MASFLSGPAAQLVGAGMQAIGVGIPVGETSAKVINGLRECGLPVPPKTWFKRKDAGGNGSAQERARDAEPSSKTIYDKLESHLNGVIQVVKPAIEIKKLLRENCCRSAERPSRRASSQSPAGDRSMYYTPQKCSSGARNLFSDEESHSPRKRRAPPKKPASKCDKRRGCSRRVGISSSDDEEEHCMYCSRSRSLLKLPCGRLICSKCDETGDHESECKQCKAAEKCRVYAY